MAIEISNNRISMTNLTPTEIEAVNRVMQKQQDVWVEEIQNIAENLNVSDECASDIWYGRTRSWWRHDIETKLIEADQKSQLNYNEVRCGIFDT